MSEVTKTENKVPDFIIKDGQKLMLDEAGKKAYEQGLVARDVKYKIAKGFGLASKLITKATTLHRSLDKTGLIQEAIEAGRNEVLAPIVANEQLQKKLRDLAVANNLGSFVLENKQQYINALIMLGESRSVATETIENIFAGECEE